MTKFWVYKPRILIDEYYDFFPGKQHTGYKLFNALTRFILYMLIGLGLFNKNITWVWTLLIVVTIFGFLYQPEAQKLCRKPTFDNPMMNPLLFTNDLNLEACNNMNKEAESLLLKSVNEDRWVLDRNKNVRRAFITTAVSKYPNDSRELGESLYGLRGREGCKTSNNNCKTYSDVRFYR